MRAPETRPPPAVTTTPSIKTNTDNDIRSHDHLHSHKHGNLFHLYPMKPWQHYDYYLRTRFPPAIFHSTVLRVSLIWSTYISARARLTRGKCHVAYVRGRTGMGWVGKVRRWGVEGECSDSEEGVLTDGAVFVNLMTSYLMTRVLNYASSCIGRARPGSQSPGSPFTANSAPSEPWTASMSLTCLAITNGSCRAVCRALRPGPSMSSWPRPWSNQVSARSSTR